MCLMKKKYIVRQSAWTWMQVEESGHKWIQVDASVCTQVDVSVRPGKSAGTWEPSSQKHYEYRRKF